MMSDFGKNYPRIRSSYKNELRRYNTQAVLAFCSSVCMPSPEHFNVQPYRYLLKDYPDKKIQQAVDEMLVEMKRRSRKKRLEVTQDGKAILLEAENILYLEKQRQTPDCGRV